MRVKIIPHGHFRKIWPLGFECEAETAAEAINAYQRLNNLKPNTLKDPWVVRVVDHPTQASLYSPLRVTELHLVPQFSGGGGFVKIVIGVVIIIAALVVNYLTGGALTPFMPYIISFAVTMILGGILELLSPAPKLTPANNNSDSPSKYLGSPKNTVAVGTRIPIAYGRYQLYGQILSFRLEADAAAINDQAPTSEQRNSGTTITGGLI